MKNIETKKQNLNTKKLKDNQSLTNNNSKVISEQASIEHTLQLANEEETNKNQSNIIKTLFESNHQEFSKNISKNSKNQNLLSNLQVHLGQIGHELINSDDNDESELHISNEISKLSKQRLCSDRITTNSIKVTNLESKGDMEFIHFSFNDSNTQFTSREYNIVTLSSLNYISSDNIFINSNKSLIFKNNNDYKLNLKFLQKFTTFDYYKLNFIVYDK